MSANGFPDEVVTAIRDSLDCNPVFRGHVVNVGQMIFIMGRARTQPRLRKMVSASPDPRARTPPQPQKTVSASPDPRAQTQPRPRTNGLRLARPLGSDSTSTTEDGLRLARPQGSDSTSTSEESLGSYDIRLAPLLFADSFY